MKEVELIKEIAKNPEPFIVYGILVTIAISIRDDFNNTKEKRRIKNEIGR